jgi:hypothetical protein
MDESASVSPRVQSAIRTLALDRLTAQVVTAFRDEGIRSVLLKGPALARWLYGQDEWRGYVDCDLLVSPDEVPAAERVLERLGFEREGLESIPGDWQKYSSAWTGPRAANIDLHHTLIGIGVPAWEFWEAMSEGTERMWISGAEVEVLRPAARALALVMHVAKDGSRRGKARHDLAHAVQRLPVELWVETAELADRLDATHAFAAGLRVVASGGELARRLNLPETAPPTEVAIRLKGGAPPLAAGMNWLLTTPGLRHKLVVIGRKIVPPPTFMRAWSPLAREGGALGLAISYLWRPVWVALRVVPAARGLWRARRAESRASDIGRSVRDDPA